MELSQFVDWAFKGILAGGLGFGVYFLGALHKSVAKLNTNVEILIERDTHKTKLLDDHEYRLRSLEHINAK